MRRFTSSGLPDGTVFSNVPDDIRDLAVKREPAEVIGARARAHGMRLLREDGLSKVRQGLTSIAEVTRVVGA